MDFICFPKHKQKKDEVIMTLYDLLNELKDTLNNILISGASFLPSVIINKLTDIKKDLLKFNLIDGVGLIDNFLTQESGKRGKYYVNLSLWIEVVLFEYENMIIKNT